MDPLTVLEGTVWSRKMCLKAPYLSQRTEFVFPSLRFTERKCKMPRATTGKMCILTAQTLLKLGSRTDVS